MTKRNLTILSESMQYFTYLLFRLFIVIIGVLPFPVLYLLSDILRPILRHVFRYRISVIGKNIDLCFPGKSEAEKQRIKDGFYRNFIDILLESVKGLGMPPGQLTERFIFSNPEQLDNYYRQGRGVILFSQHFNNWEWSALCMGSQMKHHLVGIIKLVKNPYINRYLLEERHGPNTSVVPTFKTGAYFQSTDLTDKAIGFIADQLPFGKERSVVLNFMGVETRIHSGGAHYAHQNGLPVFNIDIHRRGRGRYHCEAVMLCEDASSLTVEALTRIYKDHLEKLIRTHPECWLWSHKRFKDVITY